MCANHLSDLHPRSECSWSPGPSSRCWACAGWRTSHPGCSGTSPCSAGACRDAGSRIPGQIMCLDIMGTYSPSALWLSLFAHYPHIDTKFNLFVCSLPSLPVCSFFVIWLEARARLLAPSVLQIMIRQATEEYPDLIKRQIRILHPTSGQRK